MSGEGLGRYLLASLVSRQFTCETELCTFTFDFLLASSNNIGMLAVRTTLRLSPCAASVTSSQVHGDPRLALGRAPIAPARRQLRPCRFQKDDMQPDVDTKLDSPVKVRGAMHEP